ncbi:pathogen-related protein [Scenedesmus sp. NREL 46B-D3]|nr:pathogen-related protein [Scenedesmus sp. NREL 46B-D3]
MAAADPFVPERNYLDGEPDHVWRNGKPDYTVVNQAYLAGKTRNWVAGSLGAVVESVVKTLEMEISHKTRPEYIKTFTPNFRYSQNGGAAIDTAELIQRGSYNVLINDASYISQNFNFEDSHDAFKEAFPGGFAWECLDVLAGPPNVTFKWRHWGQFTGAYAGHEPTGETIEMYGMAIATMTDKLQVERLEIFYDPTPFLDSLAKGGASKCPFLAGSGSSS